MDIYTNDEHRQHHAVELDAGELVASWERPERVDAVRDALAGTTHQLVEPGTLDRALVDRVHSPSYVEFLSNAWDRWEAAGESGPAAMGFCWAPRGAMSREASPVPDSLQGQLGWYSFAADCSITSGTWAAVQSSAAIAQSATAGVLAGERATFGLCRPPGHHASADQFGGYCYLNNAAIAAQQLREAGLEVVSVVDIDYHHGNGTQDIFYDRADVLYASIHGDPRYEFPFFLGHANETGADEGDGFNFNEPLPAGTDFATWAAALERCLDKVQQVGTDALVISVGVDTFEKDPISQFKLRTSDYPIIGARIAQLNLPTVFLFEGGYAVAEVGENVAALLSGFEGVGFKTG